MIGLDWVGFDWIEIRFGLDLIEFIWIGIACDMRFGERRAIEVAFDMCCFAKLCSMTCEGAVIVRAHDANCRLWNHVCSITSDISFP